MTAELFAGREDKVLVGMVHLLPLPGSPGYESMGRVRERALVDAGRLVEAGFDSLLIENYGDAPFTKQVADGTLDGMKEVVGEVSDEFDVPVGINVLRNDWRGALFIVDELDISFFRLNVYTGVTYTDEGIIEGEAGKIQREIAERDIDVDVYADVHVKHGRTLYPTGLKRAAESAYHRGKADAVIVSGGRTGREAEVEDVRTVKDAVGCPVIVGSGLRQENISGLMEYADGGIVGTAIKEGGETANEVSLKRVEELVYQVRGSSPK